MEKVYHISQDETRTVLDVQSMIYDDPEKTSITCKILFKEFAIGVGYLPFSANEYDPMAMGREIFHDLKNEVWGIVEDYVAPEPPQGE